MRDFFEHQAVAQRRTRLLLLGMFLSVVAMGSCVFAGLYVLRSLLVLRVPDTVSLPMLLRPWPLFLWSVSLTAALVALAGLLRTLSLREGGSSIAEMLDARLVSGQPQDGLDRRLLNVVAEMALAAGAPVPQVYVLDREVGINALAAGWELGDSIICVTRGCLQRLTRSELQGVVAHEFSHLLHGDGRLNLRLMGAVFGMVSLAVLGKQLMRAGRFSSRRGSSLMFVGGALAALGSLGGLLGNLVKAAVSRQREYLADAAAVQFTRNPDGIAGALKKIGGFVLGSHLSSTRAEEAEHFFFENTRASTSWAWLTTHPPLRERIHRLEPSFDGQFVAPDEGVAEPVHDMPDQRVGAGALAAPHGPQAPPRVPTPRPTPQAAAREGPLRVHEVVPLIGTARVEAQAQGEPGDTQLTLDPILAGACQSGFSACGLVFALLVANDIGTARRQAARIVEHAGQHLLREAQRLHPAVQKASRLARLTLATLAAPALRSLSRQQKQVLRRTVAALIAEDGKTSIFELVLSYVLAEHWSQTKRLLSKTNAGLRAYQREARLVLSCLAHAGATSAHAAERAFEQAILRLPGLSLALLPQDARLLSGFTTALDELHALRPTARSALVEACAHAILADGRVTDDEATLLRAVCLALDAPLPPLEPNRLGNPASAPDERPNGPAAADNLLQAESKWS